MKPILLRDALKEIKTTFGRFIAIFAIVALGVGIFAGLKATTPDMKATADAYYDEYNLMDLRLLSTLGFPEDDVDALRAEPGIEAVMPSYSADALVDMLDGTVVAKLHAMDFTAQDTKESINRPELTEGRMPQKSGECLLDAMDTLGAEGAQVGDTIRISSENDQDTQDMFAVREYEIVGRVKSPYYISFQRGNASIGSGVIAYYIIIPQQDFESDYYTELYATVEGARDLATYSDEYDNLIEAQMDALVDSGFVAEREQARYDGIVEEAEEKIDDAQQELYDGQRKFNDAKLEFDDGEAELADAKTELADAKIDVDERLGDAEREIQDGEREIEDARAELKRSEKTLANGEAEYKKNRAEFDNKIAAGQQEIDAGKAELQPQLDAYNQAAAELQTGWDGLAELETQIAQLKEAGQEAEAAVLQQQADAARAELTQKQGELDGAKVQIDAAQAKIDTAQQQLNSSKAEGDAQLQAARAELDNGAQKLAAGKRQLRQAEADLAEGKETYEEKKQEAQEEIADAEQKIADAEQTLVDAEKELSDAEQELNDGKKELSDARDELNDLEMTEWFVLGRDANVGYAGYGSDADKIAAIASVFPVFFFFVAALVCLTTMTRMVEEQRTQIGVLKALGYGKGAIALKYILYALIASISGSILGLIGGFWLFPTAIANAYGIMYALPTVRTLFHWDLAVLSTTAAVASTVLAAFFACYKELAAMPSDLIRPKAPPAGKRVFLEYITPLWKRLKFIQKVTARNLFRYKKRFYMTVVGIGGCTMLMLTGFGLQDSIAGIVNRQYGELNQYDMVVAIEDAQDAQQARDVDAAMEELGGTWLYRYQTPVTAQKNGDSIDSYVVVPKEPDRLTDFMVFRERESGEQVEFPQQGCAVVSEKMASELGIAPGDTFTIKKGDTQYVDVTLGGIVENYIYNYIYLTPEDYTAAFDEQPEFGEIIFRSAQPMDAAREDEMATLLLPVEGVESVVFTTKSMRDFSDIITSLDSVVLLLIVCANLLAFIVLYNLANINLTERMREIATIKVLGFYDRETSAYVYRENLILTGIGALVGLLGGVFMHQFVVVTAEVDMVMFERNIHLSSYIYSVALTFAFALVVNFVMYFRLKKIDMVESLKSAE